MKIISSLNDVLHSFFIITGRTKYLSFPLYNSTLLLSGPSTKALNDLVLTLNSEEGIPEGPMKFNAFLFGLLK